MIYKLLPKLNPAEKQILAKIDADGLCQLTCTENDQAYLKWVAEGNVATPAEEQA